MCFVFTKFLVLFLQVGGNIFGLRESRSAAIQGPPVPSETNILVDGTLIDLCGATLLWRSVEGMEFTMHSALKMEKSAI